MAEVAIDKLNSPKSALASKAARTGVCVGFSHRFNASFGWRQQQETKIVQLVSFEEKKRVLKNKKETENEIFSRNEAIKVDRKIEIY